MLIFTLLTVPVLLVILLVMERLERWTVRVRPEVEQMDRIDVRAQIRPVGGARQ